MRKRKKSLGELPINKKQNKKKWVFLSLGLAATGALSYFGWQYWQKYRSKGAAAPADSLPSFSTPTNTTTTYTPAAPTYNPTPVKDDSFPLKKGSKGAKVKALQEVLIEKHGKTILPKYGADGDFGSETVAALKKLGLPESIDETTYNVITSTGTIDAAKTAEQLYNALSNKNLTATLAVLKTMKNTTDYEIVSQHFENYRLNGSVRQTVVNAVLSTFSDEKQKEQIRLALAAMGLKYDGSKWSLSGIERADLLITTKPTRVWRDPKTSVAVPSQMVLGKLVAARGNFTLFENETSFFLVQTNHITAYKPN